MGKKYPQPNTSTIPHAHTYTKLRRAKFFFLPHETQRTNGTTPFLVEGKLMVNLRVENEECMGEGRQFIREQLGEVFWQTTCTRKFKLQSTSLVVMIGQSWFFKIQKKSHFQIISDYSFFCFFSFCLIFFLEKQSNAVFHPRFTFIFTQRLGRFASLRAL